MWISTSHYFARWPHDSHKSSGGQAGCPEQLSVSARIWSAEQKLAHPRHSGHSVRCEISRRELHYYGQSRADKLLRFSDGIGIARIFLVLAIGNSSSAEDTHRSEQGATSRRSRNYRLHTARQRSSSSARFWSGTRWQTCGRCQISHPIDRSLLQFWCLHFWWNTMNNRKYTKTSILHLTGIGNVFLIEIDECLKISSFSQS